jgi:hypothetical protein
MRLRNASTGGKRVIASIETLFTAQAMVGRSFTTRLILRKEASHAAPDVLREHPGSCGAYIILSVEHIVHKFVLSGVFTQRQQNSRLEKRLRPNCELAINFTFHH